MDESVLCWDNMMKTMSLHTPRKKSHLWPFPQSITHKHAVSLPTGDGIMIH